MKKKILYIDDELINLQLFELHFDKKYLVYTGADAFIGLDILKQDPEISVIISDMKMPGMTGIEFIIKAKESFPEKKYFILTGYEITTEIQTALDSGLIMKYFNKPYNVNDIEIEINKAISD